MEIASVLSFGGAAVEAECVRGQRPEEAFRHCLGTAVGRKEAQQPPPEAGAEAGPEPRQVAVHGGAAGSGDAREAGAAPRPQPGAESGTEDHDDELSPAAAMVALDLA
ncbi:MAG: hypothetical protein P1P84_24530, partial [Deferrisomatales bacterium]|nr:hypothetical protein [Deferrisomatales bacterium]